MTAKLTRSFLLLAMVGGLAGSVDASRLASTGAAHRALEYLRWHVSVSGENRYWLCGTALDLAEKTVRRAIRAGYLPADTWIPDTEQRLVAVGVSGDIETILEPASRRSVVR